MLRDLPKSRGLLDGLAADPRDFGKSRNIFHTPD
jgi:hypothetical protein